jgi:hypothetical protein
MLPFYRMQHRSILRFRLLLLLLALAVGIPVLARADGQVYLKSVEFTGGYQCANLGDPLPSPEMLADFTPQHQYIIQRNWPRAYLKGSEITIKFTFAMHGNGSYSGMVMFSGFCGMFPDHPPTMYWLTFTPSMASINLGPDGTQTVTTKLTGMPDFRAPQPVRQLQSLPVLRLLLHHPFLGIPGPCDPGGADGGAVDSGALRRLRVGAFPDHSRGRSETRHHRAVLRATILLSR